MSSREGGQKRSTQKVTRIFLRRTLGWAASLLRVRRYASLVCLWAFGWPRAAVADQTPCPHDNEAWVQLVFDGAAWTVTLREAVLRELRVELGRRSLQVCADSTQTATPAPQMRVTLLADDAQRVSVIPANLRAEGGFVGRTVLVGVIPEDARALAISQAVDEALRSDPTRPIEAPSPTQAPAPQPLPIAKPPAPEPHVPNLVLGVALAPALRIAPSFAGATRASVAPGMILRLSLGSSSLGGSLGAAIAPASDLTYGSTVIREVRLPLDLSVRWRVRAGNFEGLFDVGVLAALADYERSVSQLDYRQLELGSRVGLSVGWGRRIMPWLGIWAELLPSSSELKLAPTGNFGHTPQLWLGIALGTEVRWP